MSDFLTRRTACMMVLSILLGAGSAHAAYRPQTADVNWEGTHTWESSATFKNEAFSVGGSTLVVSKGGVGIGTNSPSAESRLHIQAVSDNFGVLVDAAGTSGTEIGLHTSTSQYASLAKNAYFDAGWWQRFNTSQGAYLQEVKPDGEVWFRVVDAGANPVSWTNALTIKTNGNVGIGTADPQGYKLAVNGDAAKTGSSTWASYSDLRLKEIDGRYEHGLSEICDLQAVRYRYKQDNRMGLSAGQQYVGLIAQEVQEVIPEAVKENGEGYLMLQSDPIIWAMLNAIKELKAENEELKTRIKKLETP